MAPLLILLVIIGPHNAVFTIFTRNTHTTCMHAHTHTQNSVDFHEKVAALSNHGLACLPLTRLSQQVTMAVNSFDWIKLLRRVLLT